MPGRDCGTCTLCCKLLRVVELDKPEGSLCASCIPGQGCGVYADRPPSCRNFQCLWLMEEGFPEDLRPDRCGVIAALADDPDGIALHVDPDDPDSWRRAPAIDYIPALLNVFQRIHIVCGDRRGLVTRSAPPEPAAHP